MRAQRAAALKRDALTILRAALRAADGSRAVASHLSLRGDALIAGKTRLPLNRFDRVFLIAVGKASASMASAVEKILGSRLSAGIAVTKHGHANFRLRRTQIFESGHPVPDDAGVAASTAVEELLRNLNARDLLILAVSGGASALLPSPAPPLTLAQKQATTERLLRAGADIVDLNIVRKHLSGLKGGRLAALAFPATVVGLLLSDVIGDPLDIIGSGLSAPDPSTYADALAVLDKFDVNARVPAAVRRYLRDGQAGHYPETPKPDDPIFALVYNVVVGSNRIALEAAARQARHCGYGTLILTSTISGEASTVGRLQAEIAREVISSGNPVRPPACLLFGGETTVFVTGSGKGGRNQELALAAATALSGLPGTLLLSAGTDGTDGPTDAAGAVASGDTIARATRLGLNANAFLAAHDSYNFFDPLGDLIKTGPTGTNVMDIQIVLVA